MGQFPSDYPAKIATDLTGSEEILMDVADATSSVTNGELKKWINQVEIVNYSGDRTLLLTDAGKKLRSTAGADHAVTIPPNSSVAFPVGTIILFRVHSTGLPTLVAGIGVTLNGNDLAFTEQYQEGYIQKVDTNEWDVLLGGAGSGAGDVTAPSLISATVEDASPDEIILTYDEALNDSAIPAGGDYTASGGRTVTGVAVVGAVVTLTVNTPYANGDVITISYDGSSALTPLKDLAGNEAADLTAQSVTNNIAASGGITYAHRYDIDGANITTEVSGSDTVVRTVQDLEIVGTTYDLVTASAGVSPILVPSSMNGEPGMEIDGGIQMSWNTSHAQTKPLTLFLVVKLLTSSASYNYVLQSPSISVGFHLLKPFITGNNSTVLEGSTDVTLNQGCVIAAEFGSGSTSKIWLDGTEIASGDAGASASDWNISLYEVTNTAHFEITEVRVVDGSMSGTDRDNVIAELMTKYGIS